MQTLLFALLSTLAVVLAAPASADPADHVPLCSGDQTPMDSNCRQSPSQIVVHDGTGLSPDLPYGLTPDSSPGI